MWGGWFGVLAGSWGGSGDSGNSRDCGGLQKNAWAFCLWKLLTIKGYSAHKNKDGTRKEEHVLDPVSGSTSALGGVVCNK